MEPVSITFLVLGIVAVGGYGVHRYKRYQTNQKLKDLHNSMLGNDYNNPYRGYK